MAQTRTNSLCLLPSPHSAHLHQRYVLYVVFKIWKQTQWQILHNHCTPWSFHNAVQDHNKLSSLIMISQSGEIKRVTQTFLKVVKQSAWLPYTHKHRSDTRAFFTKTLIWIIWDEHSIHSSAEEDRWMDGWVMNTYHLTFGFWDIMSLSRASTRSLSYPVPSNFLTSFSWTSPLFWKADTKHYSSSLFPGHITCGLVSPRHKTGTTSSVWQQVNKQHVYSTRQIVESEHM